MLVRINESLGEEVIGEGCDVIIGDVLEISALPLVREMWQLYEKVTVKTPRFRQQTMTRYRRNS